MTPKCPRHRRALSLRLFAGLMLLLAAASASAWWQADWPYRKAITLDTSGIAGEGDLANVPVLIRLHEGVFHFPDAKPDGSDLRFVAGDDKTPLNFHVESFDPVFNLATIWVQVPSLAPGRPVQLWMYYGNTEATPPTEPAALTYDGDHLLVYHFSERGKPPADTTINRLDALNPVAVADGGQIGAQAVFDGNARLQLPASPKLSFLPTNALSVSLWVKPQDEAANGILYAQRDEDGHRFVIGLRSGEPYVGITDAGGVEQTSSPATALAGNKWYRLAAVADATHVLLFIDGKPVASLERALPSLSGGVSLGGLPGEQEGTVAQGFRGGVDELVIASVARTPAWQALEAGNQGGSDKLVQFGVDEQQSSISSGYFGVILASVTLDGWIVIGMLVVMMFISWWIMAAKGLQVVRVGRANTAFLAAFRDVGGDIGRLHRALAGRAAGGLDPVLVASARQSPLRTLFDDGIRELQQRLAKGRESALSEQSIEAIRASMHAVFVREQQVLSRRLVLLTIAISGGPFLGLLGTVVGVMITFAAVAATGDVNVNSIAPGISAALAATVAGLFVAIPALFGYNYLISRIKEFTIEMQVFVDVLVTRIAEAHNDEAALHALADD